ncbi:MAG: DM13 domain-containing protein [Nitrospirota bacterium]
MTQLTRVVLTTLLFAYGLAVPYAFSEMMDKEKMMDKSGSMMDGGRMAMLAGAGDHHAAGHVAITKDQKGAFVLSMTDMTIDKVPDGRVYLAKDGDYTKGVELGKLTTFTGRVTFRIPADVKTHDYNSVVIWCKKFNVEIGHAFFKEAMMDKSMMMDDKKEGMDNGMMGKEKEMMR